MGSLLQNGKQQFETILGTPLVGGKVYFYQPGTETPKATYQDQALTIANTNPIVLDSRGQAVIWGTGVYRQVVVDALGVQVWDQIVAANVSASDLAGTGGAALIGLPDGGTLAQSLTLNLNHVVDSISALRAINHTFYARAFVTGYYAPHDGGGGMYQYDPNDASSADNGGTVIVASDGARWKLQAVESVTLRQFGAKGDGSTDDSTVIGNWLNYLVQSGQRGYAPPGNYFMNEPLTTSVTGNVDVLCAKSAKFIGSSSIDQNMFLLLATADTNDKYGSVWDGGEIDFSRTVYVPGSLSGSGLALQWLIGSVVKNVKFTGPADYTQGGSFGGDTGLSLISTRGTKVSDCDFTGCRDTGIYVTGDSVTSDDANDGEDDQIYSNLFYKCAAGISVKRQSQRVSIGLNSFDYCLVNVALVTTDIVRPDPPAGGCCNISVNTMKHTGRTAIDLRYSNIVGTRVSNNIIQDFGYALDGVTPEANPTAILLEGSSYNTITNNTIEMADWTPTGGNFVGVLSQSFTYGGTSFNCENNNVSFNRFVNLDIGIRETPGEADNNKYRWNDFDNVTEEYNNISATSSVIQQDSGTWTVKLWDAAGGGNASPTTANGYFVKTGGVVTVSFTLNDIVTTGMTPGNLLYVELPFTANAAAGGAGPITLDTFAFPAGRTSASLTVAPGNTRALISTSGNGVTDGAMLVSSITSGTSDIVQATMTYPTAS